MAITESNGSHDPISHLETNFIGQKSVAEKNVLAIGTASSMTSRLSFYHTPCASSTQASTNRFGSCEVRFNKRHRTLDCSLTPNKEKKRLMYFREVNLPVQQPLEAVTQSEPPPKFLGARRDHYSPSRNTLLS